MTDRKPFALPKQVSLPLVAVGFIFVGGMTWGITSLNVQSSLERQDAKIEANEKIISVLVDTQSDLSDRTIRLEVVMEQVLKGIEEIKLEVKKD